MVTDRDALDRDAINRVRYWARVYRTPGKVRVKWETPGLVVRGLFLGPEGPYDPQLVYGCYGYVVTPAREIQEFSRAPQSLDGQLARVPSGALLIVTYTGQLPGTKPGQSPRKIFHVQWRRPMGGVGLTRAWKASYPWKALITP